MEKLNSNEELSVIRISNLEKGTVVRATTRSGGIYEFTITEPEKNKAVVKRINSGVKDLKMGEIGEKYIDSVFTLGEQIHHGNSVTSPVAKLEILSGSIDEAETVDLGQETLDMTDEEIKLLEEKIENLVIQRQRLIDFITATGDGTTEDRNMIAKLDKQIADLEKKIRSKRLS